MITRLEEIPVTKESYPFASAERYLKLSERGYVEKEYYMYGTANVYETADERGGVRVRTVDAPYTNRIIVRAPQEIILPSLIQRTGIIKKCAFAV